MSTPWNPEYKRKSKTYTSSEVKDRYNRKHYDQVAFRTGIGGKEAIKAMAEFRGMSLAEYLRHLVIQDCKASGNGDISAIIGGGGELSQFLGKLMSNSLKLR